MKQKHLMEAGGGSGDNPPAAGRAEPVPRPVPEAGGPIDETIRIRDLHQFEIKLNYPLTRDGASATYDLECYIFVPHSLQIHRGNYSKAKFYDDLQTHIRFKTPSISLPGLAGGPDGPLAKLECSVAPLQDGGHNADVDGFGYRLKLFCCILQSSLRDFVAFLSETSDPDDRAQLVRQYLNAATAIAESYRALRSRILLPAVPRRARAAYAFGDEYVSLLVERNSFDLLELLGESGLPGLPEIRREIMDLIAREVRYREGRKYPSIPTGKSNNEQLIFRRNVLKKYMQNVLFLETRTRHEGRVIEQALFGVAAGISMLFATLVLFLSQSIYGPLTLPVFLALVVGYMFKDRIKELLRLYFSRKVSSFLFDHKTRVYSDPSHPIGYCRESFDFVDETKVPERVLKIRDRDHITEIESEWIVEDILLYRKRIRLSSRAVSAAFSDIDTQGINDIIRFNVAEFTRRMGNPRKQLFVLEEEGYRRVKAERVYHLNMILRYGNEGRHRYERLRIVLNRRRIKRIERVSAEDG